MPVPYYQDDLVTLHLGDCREIREWLAADVLVTDPPYGVEWTGIPTSYSRGIQVTRTQAPIAGDHSTECRDTVLEMWGARPAICFGSWKAPRPRGVRHRLIWDKQGMAPGPVRFSFMTMDEEIYVIGDGFPATSPPQRSVITTREPRSLEVRRLGHPTPKPVGLMELLIGRCPPGVIADPFAGSGSTLLAARNLGRRAVGVELEERYCEIAAARLSEQVLDLWGDGAAS